MISGATVKRFALVNRSNETRFVKFFDSDSMGKNAVKIGETKPDLVIAVPPGNSLQGSQTDIGKLNGFA